MRRFAAPAAVLCGAGALTMGAWLLPGAVEALYARGAYRAVAAAFSFATGWAPFSVAEPLLAILIAVVLWRLGRFVRAMARPTEPRAEVVKRTALTGVAWLGGAYVAFLLLWGFNYHRRPLSESMNLPAGAATPAELDRLYDELLEEANRLREGLPQDEAGVFVPADPMAEADAAFRSLARQEPLFAGRYGRPKRAWLSSGMLSSLGVAGIYSPFTGEPHINPTLPGPSRIATICHEMAHQRGFAAEDEAEFVSVLACQASDSPQSRYSGALSAWLHVKRAGGKSERKPTPAVLRDCEALRNWAKSNHAGTVGEKMYDAYLRANAQNHGVQSYGHVVDLLIARRRQN